MNRPPQEPEGKRATRYEFARRAFVVFVLAWMIATTSLQLLGTYQTHQTTGEIRLTQQNGSPTSQKLLDILDGLTQISQDTKGIVHQLQDCLTEGGKCYQAAKRSRSQLAGLLLIQQACAVREQGQIQATQRCVARWIKAHLGGAHAR